MFNHCITATDLLCWNCYGPGISLDHYITAITSLHHCYHIRTFMDLDYHVYDYLCCVMLIMILYFDNGIYCIVSLLSLL